MAAVVLAATGSAPAQTPSFGFGSIWERGLYRTEYADPGIGTRASPLEIVGVARDRFRSEPAFRFLSEYVALPQSFAKTNNPRGWTFEDETVIVIANNEPVLDFEKCATGTVGPPDQSRPVNEAMAGGLFGLSVQRNEVWNANVWTLEINNDFQNCRGGIAYLGVGAFRGNGIPRPVGSLNRPDGTGAVTELAIQLQAARLGKPVADQPAVALVYAMAIAEWSGRKFMLFVSLFELNMHCHALCYDWDWPFRQSAFFPGARVAFLTSDHVGIPPLEPGVPRQLSLDWNRLYREADRLGLWDPNRLPADREIPLTHFEISLEGAGVDPSASIGGGTQIVVSVWNVRQR